MMRCLFCFCMHTDTKNLHLASVAQFTSFNAPDELERGHPRRVPNHRRRVVREHLSHSPRHAHPSRVRPIPHLLSELPRQRREVLLGHLHDNRCPINNTMQRMHKLRAVLTHDDDWNTSQERVFGNTWAQIGVSGQLQAVSVQRGKGDPARMVTWLECIVRDRALYWRWASDDQCVHTKSPRTHSQDKIKMTYLDESIFRVYSSPSIEADVTTTPSSGLDAKYCMTFCRRRCDLCTLPAKNKRPSLSAGSP